MLKRLSSVISAALLCACGSDSATGPATVIGTPFRLVSINSNAIPVVYLSIPGDYQATALGGSITFLANNYVRAEAQVRIHHDTPPLPDETTTTLDSVPYHISGDRLVIYRLHGWDTVEVNAGLRVHWTTGSQSMGTWRYLPK